MLVYLLCLDIERHKALDLIELKKAQGDWGSEMVYNVCLRAYEDQDRAENERAGFILRELGTNDN